MISVWLVGDLSEEVPAAVLEVAGPLAVTRAFDPQAAIGLLDSGEAPPELVVLAESRGGEHAQAALEELARRAPLARIWRLLGSWCEGETRSGRPPAGCLATYWHQWQPHFAREVERVRRGERAGWSLPATSTPDERLLADADTGFERGPRGTILVCAAAQPAAAALADLCRQAGYQVVVVADDAAFRTAGIGAVLWDTTCRQMIDDARVRRLHSSAGGAPVVAIVGFPRGEDVEHARRLGVAAVVSKPFLAADLVWQLERVMAAS